MQYDVFISYSSVDQKIAEGVCAYLEQHGIRCFVAYRDIPRGVVWAGAIVDALEHSRMMLVLFSNHFNDSSQVDREIELAAEQGMPILTFRLSSDDFSGVKKYYLKNLNWIDAFPNPERYFDLLKDNVCRLLGDKIRLSAQPTLETTPDVLPQARPIPVSNPIKRWLWLILIGVIAAFVIIFWPEPKVEGGDVPVKSDTLHVTQPVKSGTISKSPESVLVVPATTELYVTTTPAGAIVYVDGTKVGITPLEGKAIARGSHKVKLCKEGYENKTFTRAFDDKPVVLNEMLVQTKSSLKDSYTVNGVSFTMVNVVGGSFLMGSVDGDDDTYRDEKSACQVKLDSYFIGETEVTQALWQAVMGSNPSHFIGNLRRPVERVSWNDCQEFIRKLNSLTGVTFRLPTEAEWEYAARGGSRSRGYKYSGDNKLSSVAWYTDNSSGITHPVKGKSPNELGLYDMSGNVWEWCSDWKGDYPSSSQINPKGPSAGSYRVLRGGSWNFSLKSCYVTIRGCESPDGNHDYLGLRLAL